MAKVLPWLSIAVTAVCGFVCWWHHNDWWGIGVLIGIIGQVFSYVYLTDEE